MLRLGALFIGLCMTLIAGSLAAVLYLVFGVSGTEATITGLAAFTALAVYNAVTTRLRERVDLSGPISDLSRGTTDLARQVAELGRRTAALEGGPDRAREQARAATAPMSAELSELGTLVKQLAETVAIHETAISGKSDGNVRPNSPVIEPAALSELGEPEPKSTAAVAASAVTRNRDELLATIRSAADANRADLYLQPIVTLPQRKVRYYEAFTRLRTDNGTLLQPSDFLVAAETSGLIARIDNLQLFRCVQVLRRLLLKNREVGLFCNISATTLNDGELFPQMSQFLEANRALAGSLTLEFKQSAWRDMGPLEQESLAALRELGFRFCMDQVTDLRMDPRDLAARGVKFVKAPAALLLGKTGAPGTDIHAADLSDLLNRSGISLIATKVESEGQAVDLLDFDLRFGQGFLFSPPRPVRAEALQTGAEPDAPAREPSSSDRQRAALRGTPATAAV